MPPSCSRQALYSTVLRSFSTPRRHADTLAPVEHGPLRPPKRPHRHRRQLIVDRHNSVTLIITVSQPQPMHVIFALSPSPPQIPRNLWHQFHRVSALVRTNHQPSFPPSGCGAQGQTTSDRGWPVCPLELNPRDRRWPFSPFSRRCRMSTFWSAPVSTSAPISQPSARMWRSSR